MQTQTQMGQMAQMGQPQQPPINLGAFNPMGQPQQLAGGFNPMQTQTQMGQMAQMGQPQQPPMNLGAFNPMGQPQQQPLGGMGQQQIQNMMQQLQQQRGMGVQQIQDVMQQLQNQMNTAPQAPAQPAAPTRMGMTPELLRNFVVPAIRNFDVRQFMDSRDRGSATRMGQPDRPPGGPRSKQGSGQQMDTAPQMPPQQPMVPQAPNASYVREEDPRMRTMRALQQFANRQRGFPFG
jgi:hypothetical protein